MRNACRYLAVLALVAGASATLVGCSGSGSAEQDRVARVLSEFEGAELSAFEEAVLADGKVTQAEYDEAFTKWSTCATSKGLTVTDERDGYGRYYWTLVQSPETVEDEAAAKQDEVAERACSQGVTWYIDAVYVDQVMNPDSRNWEEGIVDCLKVDGLVNPDFTVQDLKDGKLPETEEIVMSGCLDNPFGVKADR